MKLEQSSFYFLAAMLIICLFCVIIIIARKNVSVAQLDRVFGYEPKGRGFESLTACQDENPVDCGGILILIFAEYKET